MLDSQQRNGKQTAAVVGDGLEMVKVEQRQARRSLRYENNENVIDESTTEYVLSRKRPVTSPRSTEQPRKRCRADFEVCTLDMSCTLESFDDTTDRGSPPKSLTMVVGRKSGQWKVSTPSRERTLTPQKDTAAPSCYDTPSKSVTFHDSVVGGETDKTQTPKSRMRTPKKSPQSGGKTSEESGGKTPRSGGKTSESGGKTSESGGKTPGSGRRGQNRSGCDESAGVMTLSAPRTPRSGQRGRPADVGTSLSGPPRSSARKSSSLQHSDGRSATRSDRKSRQKESSVMRCRSVGTGRVLRPRTPKSYKFAVTNDNDSDFDASATESSSTDEDDDRDLHVKKTPSRRNAAAEVCQLSLRFFCCSTVVVPMSTAIIMHVVFG